ncbi:unnamed protein product [Symbiodinium sp. CCMP2592]|nr:unnamed protein product [Symbiodinium sp. CCMP2592]
MAGAARRLNALLWILAALEVLAAAEPADSELEAKGRQLAVVRDVDLPSLLDPHCAANYCSVSHTPKDILGLAPRPHFRREFLEQPTLWVGDAPADPPALSPHIEVMVDFLMTPVIAAVSSNLRNGGFPALLNYMEVNADDLPPSFSIILRNIAGTTSTLPIAYNGKVDVYDSKRHPPPAAYTVHPSPLPYLPGEAFPPLLCYGLVSVCPTCSGNAPTRADVLALANAISRESLDLSSIQVNVYLKRYDPATVWYVAPRGPAPSPFATIRTAIGGFRWLDDLSCSNVSEVNEDSLISDERPLRETELWYMFNQYGLEAINTDPANLSISDASSASSSHDNYTGDEHSLDGPRGSQQKTVEDPYQATQNAISVCSLCKGTSGKRNGWTCRRWPRTSTVEGTDTAGHPLNRSLCLRSLFLDLGDLHLRMFLQARLLRLPRRLRDLLLQAKRP